MSSGKVKSHAGSASSSVASQATSGRYFRPVPYSTTLALHQFFEGGSMDEYALKRTTASSSRATPSPHPSHSSHRSSRSNNRHSTSAIKPSKSTSASSSSSNKPSSSSRPSSSRGESSEPSKRSRTKPISNTHIAPETSVPDRDVGKGASLPVVDENGQIWYDWEEKQEYTPLMVDEEQQSAWVGFPGAPGHESDSSEEDPVTPVHNTFALRAELEAFSFQSAVKGEPAAINLNEELLPPPRLRGTDRRLVRADSLPTIPTTTLPQLHILGQEEFLASSFDPFKATEPTSLKSTAQIPLPLSISKRTSFSLKGIKKLLGKKVSAPPVAVA